MNNSYSSVLFLKISQFFLLFDAVVDAFDRPKEPKLPKTTEEKSNGHRVIVVLTKAALETVKTKKGYELLNADEHKGILQKHGKDPSEYRPDIVHQVYSRLFDFCWMMGVDMDSIVVWRNLLWRMIGSIKFQALLTLLDSPLNKAGLLQVYVHTNNVRANL